MKASEFEKSLDKYAELIVKVGINLQKGQPLFINGKSFTRGVALEAAPLVRKIAEQAYKTGAPLVDILWDDPEVAKARLQEASLEAIRSHYPAWRTEGAYQELSEGAALYTLYADDPEFFSGLDTDKVNAAQAQMEKHMAKPMDLLMHNLLNWSLSAAAVEGWARKVFPEMKSEEALEKLWQTIFRLCRLDQDDPVQAWQEHLARLDQHADHLNEKQYDALKYSGPGTDLVIGMPKGHSWRSARITNIKGITHVANMPTEEVFSAPHRERADGTVKAALPLNYGATLIEDFSVTFKDGRAVGVEAKRGQDALETLIATDEGAARLGEVALVPQSSPIAQSGILFYNTLFDENASCHIALGAAPRECIQGGDEMSDEDFAAVGGNSSTIHVDFMIGSDKMDIDGLSQDGKAEPIMRQGEWAFKV